MSDFGRRFGFSRRDVTLANWRTAPYSAWAFQNVSELVPSASFAAEPGHAETPPADARCLLDEAYGEGTIETFLRRSNTDLFCIMKAGRFVGDWQAEHADAGAAHIVFSISKSLTAVLAGALQAQGLLDPEAPVSSYVPELGDRCAYRDATVRHLLDMTVSLDFEESYLDPEGAFARYRRATLWHPALPAEEPESLLGFLASLPKGGAPHGGPFRYRSPNSDLLGIVLERASGRRVAALMADLLWRPLGACSDGMVTVDREGSARTAGGISVTARDLARVGEMMRCAGLGQRGRVVPEGWVADTLTAGDPEAWRQGDFPHLLPGGRYRNQWYAGAPGGGFFAIGIHGQWLFIDPTSEVVIVKLSSQPIPVDDALDRECLMLFQTLSAIV